MKVITKNVRGKKPTRKKTKRMEERKKRGKKNNDGGWYACEKWRENQ